MDMARKDVKIQRRNRGNCMLEVYIQVAILCVQMSPCEEEDSMEENEPQPGSRGAETLLFQNDVKVYLISPAGHVTTPSETQTLRLLLLQEKINVHGNDVPAILEVGNLIYPLIPGLSTVLRSSYGSYVMPDVESEEEGVAVAVIVPKDADEDFKVALDGVANGVVYRRSVDEHGKPIIKLQDRNCPVVSGLDVATLKRDPQNDIHSPGTSTVARNRGPSISQRAKRHIETTSTAISAGIVEGAMTLSNLVYSKMPHLLEHIRPASKTASVSPSVKENFRKAREISLQVLGVQDLILKKIGQAVMFLVRLTKCRIAAHSQQMLTGTLNFTPEDSQKLEEAWEVMEAGVEGVAVILDGLARSAAILAQALIDNTVLVVEHTMGRQVAETTDDALQTVNNVISAGVDVILFRNSMRCAAALRLITRTRQLMSNREELEMITDSIPLTYKS